jgi:hypothetical protein
MCLLKLPRLAALASLFAAAAVAFAGCGTSGDSSGGSSSANSAGANAKYLSKLETGSEDEAPRFQQILDELTPRCQGSEQDVAGIIYALRKNGLTDSYMTAAEDLSDAVPSGSNFDCRGAAAALLTQAGK